MVKRYPILIISHPFKMRICCRALKRVTERIHMENIHRLIDAKPAITEVQKGYDFRNKSKNY